MKIAIYLPAYNAAESLVPLLDRNPPARLASVEEVFIVDNASTETGCGRPLYRHDGARSRSIQVAR